MKVIFLDIDGVLATRTEFGKFSEVDDNGIAYYPFRPSCVEALNAITDRTGACIVVSSTWRKLHEWPALVALLKKQGVTGSVIDKTPSKRDREEEISEWISVNVYTLDIEKVVVLDDEYLDDDGARPDIKTIDTEGLLMEHVEAACECLRVRVQDPLCRR